MAEWLGFSQIATQDLERLASELARIPAASVLTKPHLAALRLGHVWNAIQGLMLFDAAPLAMVIRAVLAERAAHQETKVDLVWTGSEARTAYARPTATVLRELFACVERHCLVAGYSFDHGGVIFEPLYAAMTQRQVDVEIYVHVRRARSEQSLAEHVRAEVATFLAANWPFGLPYPAIYIAPRTIEPDLNESLHAKCCVVDERVALIGSANFTDRGQSRNIEVGARIEEPGFARALVAQFHSAIGAEVFRRVGE